MSGQLGREVVIVEAVRTPIGRGHPEKGYYKDTHPADLLGATYTELIERSGIDASEVEVIAGCAQQMGEQAMNVARNAWLQEGFPLEAAATTLDRQCGSAQTAVNFGAALIGIHDVVIGSGVEHMGHVSFQVGEEIAERYGSPITDKFRDHYDVRGQGIGAELIADQWEIPRSELDELAVRLHERAARATDSGDFEREIVPMRVNGDTVMRDQGIPAGHESRGARAAEAGIQARRQGHGGQRLADLGRRGGRAADVAREGGGARSHAARTDPRPDDRWLRPGQDARGTHPCHGEDPGAQRDVARRHRLHRDQRGVRARRRGLAARAQSGHGAGQPRGGAIALGHPLGSTGARLITTLLHELEDDDKEIGFVTMCCGGGLGTGTLIERI